ncbi:RHS repeat-associated core domain-containing protein [Pseudomonas sp. S2_H01]
MLPIAHVICRYHYDALDRLVAATPLGEATVQRVYQKNLLSVEIQGAMHRQVMQFDDHVLAEQCAAETVLPATDLQRSVLHSVDAQGQQGIAYSPYGHRPSGSDVFSLLGFAGERPDPVTGHYPLGQGYRSYNPVLMRFNQPDSLSPFGEGGVNAYAYCQGDPVNRSDPTGHMFRVNLRPTSNRLPAQTPSPPIPTLNRPPSPIPSRGDRTSRPTSPGGHAAGIPQPDRLYQELRRLFDQFPIEDTFNLVLGRNRPVSGKLHRSVMGIVVQDMKGAAPRLKAAAIDTFQRKIIVANENKLALKAKREELWSSSKGLDIKERESIEIRKQLQEFRDVIDSLKDAINIIRAQP